MMPEHIYLKERSFNQRYAAFLTAVCGQKLQGVYQEKIWQEDEDLEWEDGYFDEWGERIVLQFDDSQYTITFWDSKCFVEPSCIAIHNQWKPDAKQPSCLTCWGLASPVQKQLINKIVPYYCMDRVTGITLIYENGNIAIFDDYGVEVRHRVPAPKYILRKQTRQVIGTMKEYLIKFHGMKIFHCGFPNMIKEFSECIPEKRAKIARLFGARQLYFTYNAIPNDRELLDIFVELNLNVEDAMPSLFLAFCQHICKGAASCRHCPVSQWCNQLKMPLLES